MDKNKKFRSYFKKMSDKELIDAFNREVGNMGWTSSRALYLAALHQEFDNREYDYSKIGDKSRLSFKRKINLLDKKVEFYNKREIYTIEEIDKDINEREKRNEMISIITIVVIILISILWW